MREKYIIYYRVSTREQENSGLGLAAQKRDCLFYVSGRSGDVIGTYTEIESGRNDDRPELAKALTHAQLSDAILIISKIDRLTRSLKTLVRLRDSGVKFRSIDMPAASDLTITLMAAFAEQEAGMISQRTKKALAEARERGVKLGGCRAGSHAFTTLDRKKSADIKIKSADDWAFKIYPLVEALDGLTLQEQANELNARGLVTRRGKSFSPATVCKIRTRIKNATRHLTDGTGIAM